MAVVIERQVPERGGRGAVVSPAGHSCCCCCCCLHTVGGVIGALSGSVAAPVVEVQIPASAVGRATREPRYSATGLYWRACLVISCLSIAGFLIAPRSELAGGALLLAMTWPAVQLGASIVAAIMIACSKRDGKQLRLRHLGKITWRAFLGALIGCLVMIPLLSRC